MKKILDRVITSNLFDPGLLVEPEFSDEENQALKEVFESLGWEILMNKVWGHAMRVLMLETLINKNDTRYYQGMFMGYKQFTDIAYKTLRSSHPGDDAIKEMFESLGDGSNYDNLKVS